MTEFEEMLSSCQSSAERYVKFKIHNLQDAEDILQEIYLTAFQRLDSLEDKSRFKAWIISIARNKCKDYYRRNSVTSNVPIDSLSETLVSDSCDYLEPDSVLETISALTEADRQIMRLFYIFGYNQTEISQQLNIPIGTSP